MTHETLNSNLKKLCLYKMASQYIEIARSAEKKQSTYEQYLASLAESELAYKKENRIKRHIAEAKLPYLKRIESYDWSQRTGFSLKEFNRLAEGHFVREAVNIVFYGTFGVGKTHLSTALAINLCANGYRCYFTSTHALIEQLLTAKQTLSLAQLMKKLDRFDLIICDELGYIPQTKDGADLFFQLISQRDERKSFLFTTNLTYSEWDKVFLNPLSTAAAVDRIIHKNETFHIKGPSWRAEAAKKRNEEKTKLTKKETNNISQATAEN